MITMEFLGHAGWRFTDGTSVLLVDPWLTGNPKAACRAGAIERADAILVTHAHADHLGDTIDIARRTGAAVVATFELVNYCMTNGATQGHGMNLGGAHTFPWGKVKLTLAYHTSSCGESDPIAVGEPCGFLIDFGGYLIYHAGDTALYGDMELLGRRHAIDVTLLPIGDNFTMGPEDALEAVRMLRPKRVVPMHYNTFPVIETDPHAWAEQVRSLGVECRVLDPGELWTINGG